jgi:hypothetical protein
LNQNKTESGNLYDGRVHVVADLGVKQRMVMGKGLKNADKPVDLVDAHYTI